MKYWRGYLVAGIVALCTWALGQFAAAHTQLVDMVYPYITRIIMDYLAVWSADVAGCLWQTILVFLIVLFLASIVLMVVLRWNPVQWFGWVLAVVSLFSLLNTGLYGLNEHAGPISEDVRLELREYSVGSLERAANYYRDMANQYAGQVSRNPDGSVKGGSFEALAQQAADGFNTLAYDKTYPIFTGSTEPVKELGWSGLFNGTTGITVALTGESAVNPNVPPVGIPYAICHEMCHRMCVYSHTDADFGAFLACTANADPMYQYSGYLMAFRQCYNALKAIHTEVGRTALQRVLSDTDQVVLNDMEDYNAFLGKDAEQVEDELCKMLVSWHMQEIARYDEEDEEVFDPMDETDDRFQDILYPADPDEDA
ncbi:MAG: DUF3810 family protein [Oscillospiraceae bacterium]|nr:DUF3810 family protein [Oscillospiraceae bacterium]